MKKAFPDWIETRGEWRYSDKKKDGTEDGKKQYLSMWCKYCAMRWPGSSWAKEAGRRADFKIFGAHEECVEHKEAAEAYSLYASIGVLESINQVVMGNCDYNFAMNSPFKTENGQSSGNTTSTNSAKPTRHGADGDSEMEKLSSSVPLLEWCIDRGQSSKAVTDQIESSLHNDVKREREKDGKIEEPIDQPKRVKLEGSSFPASSDVSEVIDVFVDEFRICPRSRLLGQNGSRHQKMQKETGCLIVLRSFDGSTRFPSNTDFAVEVVGQSRESVSTAVAMIRRTLNEVRNSVPSLSKSPAVAPPSTSLSTLKDSPSVGDTPVESNSTRADVPLKGGTTTEAAQTQIFSQTGETKETSKVKCEPKMSKDDKKRDKSKKKDDAVEKDKFQVEAALDTPSKGKDFRPTSSAGDEKLKEPRVSKEAKKVKEGKDTKDVKGVSAIGGSVGDNGLQATLKNDGGKRQDHEEKMTKKKEVKEKATVVTGDGTVAAVEIPSAKKEKKKEKKEGTKSSDRLDTSSDVVTSPLAQIHPVTQGSSEELPSDVEELKLFVLQLKNYHKTEMDNKQLEWNLSERRRKAGDLQRQEVEQKLEEAIKKAETLENKVQKWKEKCQESLTESDELKVNQKVLKDQLKTMKKEQSIQIAERDAKIESFKNDSQRAQKLEAENEELKKNAATLKDQMKALKRDNSTRTAEHESKVNALVEEIKALKEDKLKSESDGGKTKLLRDQLEAVTKELNAHKETLRSMMTLCSLQRTDEPSRVDGSDGQSSSHSSHFMRDSRDVKSLPTNDMKMHPPQPAAGPFSHGGERDVQGSSQHDGGNWNSRRVSDETPHSAQQVQDRNSSQGWLHQGPIGFQQQAHYQFRQSESGRYAEPPLNSIQRPFPSPNGGSSYASDTSQSKNEFVEIEELRAMCMSLRLRVAAQPGKRSRGKDASVLLAKIMSESRYNREWICRSLDFHCQGIPHTAIKADSPYGQMSALFPDLLYVEEFRGENNVYISPPNAR